MEGSSGMSKEHEDEDEFVDIRQIKSESQASKPKAEYEEGEVPSDAKQEDPQEL